MIKHICDICKKDIEENPFKIIVPVLHEYIATNGNSILGKMVAPKIEEKEIEICYSCTKHLANILYDNFDIHN